jgi:hypothetical protein
MCIHATQSQVILHNLCSIHKKKKRKEEKERLEKKIFNSMNTYCEKARVINAKTYRIRFNFSCN